MKVCPKCGELKYYAMFYKASGRSDGMRSYCIKCDQAYNRPKVLAIIKKRYREDPAFNRKRKEYSKKWAEENHPQYLSNQKGWYKNNRNRHLGTMKKNYNKNRDWHLEYSRQYYIKNNLRA